METWMHPVYPRTGTPSCLESKCKSGEKSSELEWEGIAILEYHPKELSSILTSPGKTLIGEDIISWWREMTKGNCCEVGRLRARRRTGEVFQELRPWQEKEVLSVGEERAAIYISETETHFHNGVVLTFISVVFLWHNLGLFLATLILANKQKMILQMFGISSVRISMAIYAIVSCVEGLQVYVVDRIKAHCVCAAGLQPLESFARK